MTRFVSMRVQGVGGSITEPMLLETPGQAGPLAYKALDAARVGAECAGKDVVFAVHGFNVSRDKGARSLAALEASLQLGANDAFFGVLWPGDAWLPVVNYPGEAKDAVTCGKRLAAFIDRTFARAASLSFVSHSLGGRVLLEAVARLGRPVREACIAAGAVDYDCLAGQYAAAAANAGRTTVLASRKDKVLQLAYPLGDFASDVFYDDDSPWARALGLKGPKAPAVPPIQHQQIPDGDGYGHGHYFPPGDGSASPASAKWRRSAEFMRRTLRGDLRRWP